MKNSNWVLMTESASDVPVAIRKKYGIECYKVPLILDGEDYDYDIEKDEAVLEIYKLMREGKVFKTAAVSPTGYEEIIEAYFKQGKDILYVAYSGAISNALNFYLEAAGTMMKKYPGRKALLADTLSLSYGSGTLVVEAAEMLQNGIEAEEIIKYVEENRQKRACIFTVENLVYLKRGGRISTLAATVGGILNLKPALCITEKGLLASYQKVPGRKRALQTLCDTMAKLGTDLQNQVIHIIHADCSTDAEELKKIIMQRFSPKEVNISLVGVIVGVHAGPGTIGVLFHAKARQ